MGEEDGPPDHRQAPYPDGSDGPGQRGPFGGPGDDDALKAGDRGGGHGAGGEQPGAPGPGHKTGDGHTGEGHTGEGHSGADVSDDAASEGSGAPGPPAGLETGRPPSDGPEPVVSASDTPEVGQPGGSSSGVGRATAVMAVGTTLSRLTGVIRIVVLGYALGTSYLADDYNLANTIPNIIHDIVLGGVVSATFIPVFVHRLTTRSDDDAWDGISAVTSVTMIVIGAASVLFLVLAPFIIDATTALNHSSQAGQDRRLATELLLLFVPQLACYGFISLGTALLNARRRFGAPMFSSIANNLVLIAVLLYFAFTVKSAARTPGGLLEHRDQLLLLGLGTTAGVVAQAALMVPSLRRAGLRLTWKPDVHHEAVRTIIRLSGWTFGLVAANQVALTVVLALADSIKGAVTAYTYAWTVFQLPYGVVAVSIMAATAPELTAFWSRGDRAGFRRRMAIGLRTTTAIIVPAAAGLLILSHPLAALLFAHGSTTVIGSIPIATALAMLTIGLPGFCVFLYAIRVLQSVQDLRSAFWLYVLENGINIVAAVILVGPLGLRGIALSISIAYTVSAVVALVYVRSRVHGLDADVILRPLLHVGLSTAALVVGAALGSNVSASESTPGLLLRVVVGALAGGAAFIVTAGVLGGRRHRPAGRPHDGPPPSGGRRPDRGRPDGPPRRSRRPGAPPAPAPLPPAGRPPMRPTRLGPSRGAEPESSGRGRLDA